MVLLVCYAHADRAIAEEVRAICTRLEVPCMLDERNDWLMHGLRAEPVECSHLLVVVSAANDRSWWLPFRLGRAAEEGLTVVPFLTDPELPLPDFLHTLEPLADLSRLESRLREWSESAG